MTDEVVWEDPPRTSGRTPGVWVERLAPLKQRPNRWARLPYQVTSGMVSHLRSGRTEGIEPGEWEFKRLKHEDGHALWARYIGKPVKAVG